MNRTGSFVAALLALVLGLCVAAERADAAYLPQRGPAPLRWRPEPPAIPAATNPPPASTQASHPAPEAHPDKPATHSLSTAPSPDSSDFVGPLQPASPASTAPSTSAPPDPAQPNHPNPTAAAGSPPPAAGGPTEPSEIVIGNPEARQVINAQMLVRFFQAHDPSTNLPLTATAGALPLLAVPRQTGPGLETSILIPVQFLPPEPFTRPQSSGSSATYTVTPKP